MTDFEGFLNWMYEYGVYDIDGDYYDINAIKDKVKSAIQKIKEEETNGKKRNSMDKWLRSFNSEKSDESHFWENMKNKIEDNKANIAESIEQEVKEKKDYIFPEGLSQEVRDNIDENIFDIKKEELEESDEFEDVFIPNALPENKKIILNEIINIKKNKEIEIKEKRILQSEELKGKKLLVRETELEEKYGTLPPQIKQKIRERKIELLGDARILTRDIRKGIKQSNSLSDVEGYEQQIQENQELILSQKGGSVALDNLTAFVRIKKSEFM